MLGLILNGTWVLFWRNGKRSRKGVWGGGFVEGSDVWGSWFVEGSDVWGTGFTGGSDAGSWVGKPPARAEGFGIEAASVFTFVLIVLLGGKVGWILFATVRSWELGRLVEVDGGRSSNGVLPLVCRRNVRLIY